MGGVRKRGKVRGRKIGKERGRRKIREVIKMPPRLNSKQFQNNVIDFICERLGIHAYASLKNRITFRITRGSIVFQLWILPAEKKQYRRTSKCMGKKKKSCQWTPTHLQIFEE